MADPVNIVANIRTVLRRRMLESRSPELVDAVFAAARRSSSGNDIQHVLWMLDQIEQGEVEGDRAQRWVGDVMGWLRRDGALSLDDCRYASLFA